MNVHSQTNTGASENATPKKEKRAFRVSVRDEVIAEWRALGGAIMLFLWCVNRTTLEETNAETGIREGSVYGGRYCRDSDIAAEIGCHPNTIKIWRRNTVRASYIRVNRGSNGYQYFVLNSCKWPEKSAPGVLADGQPNVYLKDKICLSEPQNLSITESVSLYDSTGTLKRKSGAKTARSSQGDFENLKIKEFLEFWGNEYQRIYDRRPTLHWGKEIKRLGPVFRQHGEQSVKAAALSYLEDNSDFVAGHGLGIFVSQFDRWLSKATRGSKARPATADPAGGGKFDELVTL
jgi:hypothetical protein